MNKRMATAVLLSAHVVGTGAQTAPASSPAAASAPSPAASSPAAVPGMPPAPTTVALDNKRPKCPDYRITRTDKYLMEKCRALWEDYLQLDIEGFRRGLTPYVRDLQRLDTRLQLQVRRQKLDSDTYEEYRLIIADEILDATKKTGRYLQTYLEYVDAYKRQVQLLKEHWQQASA
jgi:hypothetical protein